jgi:hypothetical protein
MNSCVSVLKVVWLCLEIHHKEQVSYEVWEQYYQSMTVMWFAMLLPVLKKFHTSGFETRFPSVIMKLEMTLCTWFTVLFTFHSLP